MMLSVQRRHVLSPGSLLFHIEAADGCFDHYDVECLTGDQTSHVNTLLAAQNSFESQLRRDVHRSTESIRREDGKVDIVVLASRLVLIGYKVSIRTAMGGGAGQECFRNLSYEFLLVSSYKREGLELIVDPKFREQFRLSQQTHRYSQLLDLLPATYVGELNSLACLVKLLSGEMEAVFSETGITMPPWRLTGSMMSKWKPLKSRDTEVNSPKLGGASPRGNLSLCSSRSSSSCSDISPERDRSLTAGLQRQASVPKRVQSGFCVNKTVCGKIPEYQVLSGSDSRPPQDLCVYCALTADHDRRNEKSGLHNCRVDKRGHTGCVGGLKEEGLGLGLTKIRTVKLGGGR